MGHVWATRSSLALRRAIFMGKVVAAGASGLESYCLLQSEMVTLDKVSSRFLRSLEEGKACSWTCDRLSKLANQAVAVTIMRHALVHPVWAQHLGTMGTLRTEIVTCI